MSRWRSLGLVLAAALAFTLVGAASASAAVYVGTSDPHNVSIHLFTNNKGKPTNLHFGRYKVPCTNGYEFDTRVTGAVPPFTRAAPGRLFDRQRKVVRDGDVFESVTKARQHGNEWRGRFHSLWVFKDDGDPYTRCEFGFRFTLDLKRP